MDTPPFASDPILRPNFGPMILAHCDSRQLLNPARRDPRLIADETDRVAVWLTDQFIDRPPPAGSAGRPGQPPDVTVAEVA